MSLREQPSDKSYTIAVCLSAIFGVVGIQHFYLGRIVEALIDRQVDPSRLLAVANRCRKRTPTLRLEDAREALGDIEVFPVSNDFAGAVKAMNLGRPLADVAPRSALRQDLRRLAERLPEPSSPSSTPQTM